MKRTRIIAFAALIAGVFAAGVVLLRGGQDMTLHVQFTNAGLLVEGGRVQVAGRKVGSIEEIRITDNGLADIRLNLTDSAVLPLHSGTRATIRAVGQAGLANRYVDLKLGPETMPELPDGTVLGTNQTAGIVSLDAIINSFDPASRANLQGLINHSADVFAGSAALRFNAMADDLAPALSETGAMFEELSQDRVALRGLVRTASQAATQVASRRDDLTAAVEHTASAMGAIADERRSLSDMLEHAPPVLDQARGTLARTATAVTTLRPALRDIPATAESAAPFLEQLSTTLPATGLVAQQLSDQLPDLQRALTGLSPLERPAIDALETTGRAMTAFLPIFEAFRFYGSDLVLGVLASLGGAATGPYDETGHYAKLNFVQAPQTLPGGRLSPLLTGQALVPGVIGVRIKTNRRCPGGNVPPSPDGSSPWDVGEAICSIDQTTPASVNEP